MSTTTQVTVTADSINDFLNDLSDGNGFWAGRIFTLSAILTLNQDWELDGDELDELSGHMVDDGLPAATREEITLALVERGFEIELLDAYLLGEIISEVGVDAEEVIEAARQLGVDEDILQEFAADQAA